MKKLLVFAVFALAILSFGTNIGLAHAQTAQPTVSSATLLQELQVMKATLVNLESKAGMVPQGDSGLPSGTAGTTGSAVTPTTGTVASGLSASDRAALSSSLGALVSVLSSFNATLAANPQAVSAHQAAIAAVLNGMTKTMVAMNSALNGSAAAPSTGIAMSQPSVRVTPTTPTTQAPAAAAPTPTPAPVAVSNQPAPQPSTGSLAPTAAPAGTNNQQQTAQASNAWGFVVNHWPTITIVVLVALILLILFWPSSGDNREEHGSPRPVAKPQVPNRPVASNVTQSSSREETRTATPVATVVSAPAAKVTVIRPQKV